ncbi:MAG TPA: Holliday junction branch migration protein RuvA [Geminicoccaceae bacterium]|nr:Holliday junction branch migration protein RuvA [Geminicoccaceae bacterium]
MIARLRGRLDSQDADHLVIDVGGVGYLVHCSGQTLARLPRAGEAVDLHIETQVRAESIMLYGFAEVGERSWFRVLQQVQGVGARVALGVLSVLTPEELSRAVASQDKAALTRASGVGPRLAGRILSELKDRLAGELAGATLPARGLTGDAADGAVSGAVSALVHLGYGRSEALAAVSRAAAAQGGGATLEALIRAGLQELAQA